MSRSLVGGARGGCGPSGSIRSFVGEGGANSLPGIMAAPVSVEVAGTDSGTAGTASGTAGISATGMSPTSARIAVFEKAVDLGIEAKASTDERVNNNDAKERSRLRLVISKYLSDFFWGYCTWIGRLSF